MGSALRVNGVEWRICSYLIRVGRPVSLSEIEYGLKLPSSYWAEHYVSRMVEMRLLDKREDDRYDLLEDIKPKFILSYFKDVKRRAVQRFHLNAAFVSTLVLIYGYYMMFLPRNAITTYLFTFIFALVSILILIFEGINYIQVRKNLGV